VKFSKPFDTQGAAKAAPFAISGDVGGGAGNCGQLRQQSGKSPALTKSK